jgi:hypothetical protein
MVFCIAILVFFWRVRRIYAEFRSFLTPPGENQPSAFSQLVEVVSQSFARAILATFKAQFMGTQGSLARAEKAVAGDIMEDAVASASPVLGTILQSFPALRRTLRRNPGLIDLVVSRLGSAAKSPDNGKTIQVELPKFNL